MSDCYIIPEKIVSTEMIVVNSRFISVAGPVFSTEEAREFIQSVKRQYPDASHHVPAYVIGHGNSTVAYCSDDGEPSGSSGKPILSVLQGSGFGDAIIVVTRYFGGTKLGIGGLVHAYGDAAKSVLEIMPKAVKVSTCLVQISMPYSFYERIRLLIIRKNAQILDEYFQGDVTITGRFLTKTFDQFQSDLSELTAGKIQAQIMDTNPETIMPFGAFEE